MCGEVKLRVQNFSVLQQRETEREERLSSLHMLSDTCDVGVLNKYSQQQECRVRFKTLSHFFTSSRVVAIVYSLLIALAAD